MKKSRRAAVRGSERADEASALRKILARTRTSGFQKYLEALVVELCNADSTPRPDVRKMAAAEDACFRVLERELSAMHFPGAQLERKAINPGIRTHPNYSLLHFTKTADRPEGLSPQEAYAGRANLVFRVPGSRQRAAGCSVALNAHVDVVPPYFPPRARNGVVHGRGACDDKGPVVAIVGALKVLSEVMAETGMRFNRNVLGMFVVEEETGGNGSLSLASDAELKPWYDSIVVCECTGLRIHPANRGAVWYRADLKAPEGVPALELFAFVNEEMEKEGAAIRAESRHPLFPQRPVQTCHGVIGPFGEHPSRICGEVIFNIKCDARPGGAVKDLVEDCLTAGLAGYVGLYGDKTKARDEASGKPLVARHYDLRATSEGFEVAVHGAAGHMGAIRERDGAITKMAHLVRSLVYSKAKIEAAAGGTMRIELQGVRASQPHTVLVLEGGQGFVPTHGMEEVMQRLRRAAERGAENYLRHVGRAGTGSEVVTMKYEKLHNSAFDGDPGSASMRNAAAAARACGLWKGEPIAGWTVSCDARLFATQYPGMQVLTFGPGQLSYAHSDQEQIAVADVRKAAEFLALFLLRQTGTKEIRRPTRLRQAYGAAGGRNPKGRRHRIVRRLGESAAKI
jgi:acetylornithine deacetylase/succinyl-diaminopimelate desuccinylase-like protein